MSKNKLQGIVIRITAKDLAIMLVAALMAVVLFGVVLHDWRQAGIVAASAIGFTFVADCIKVRRRRQDNADPEPPPSGTDGFLYIVCDILMLGMGMLMVAEGGLFWLSSDGEYHEIFDFSDMAHVKLVGWLLVICSLWFMGSRLVHVFTDRKKQAG